jgi:membrane-associated phospholipid phosphatase
MQVFRAFVLLICCSAFTASVLHAEEHRADDYFYANRDLGDFTPDLGKNFTNLFSAKNAPGFIALAFSSLLAHQYDGPVQDYFSIEDRIGAADEVGDWLGGTKIVAGTTAGVFLLSRLSDDSRLRSFGYSLAQAVVLNSVLTVGVKYTVGRMRPDQSDQLSFLSGHTSNTFAIATVLNHYYGKKAGIPAFSAAAFIALSRIEGNVHYLSDVVAGAMLGYMVARTVVSSEEELAQRQWFLAPSVSPNGTGAGLRLTIQF